VCDNQDLGFEDFENQVEAMLEENVYDISPEDARLEARF